MTFLERYKAGEHAAVWSELEALGAEVRQEPHWADACAVAAETMRRARHNVEVLIQRLDSAGYRFQDTVSSAEDQLSRFDAISQLSQQMQARAALARPNVHIAQILDNFQAMQAKLVPLLEKTAAKASREAAAKRKPPLEDPHVFSPPGKKTASLLARLEKAIGGPLPLSLRAWYEQVGGVSLMGSHPALNPVDFSSRGAMAFVSLGMQSAPQPPAAEEIAPDPLVVYPAEELLDQMSDREKDEDGGAEIELVIAPDDLHKANISGDACYISLPDARADFQFDDWHNTTFVNYLRSVFQWGGFPGWERFRNPPSKEIAALSAGLLPI